LRRSIPLLQKHFLKENKSTIANLVH